MFGGPLELKCLRGCIPDHPINGSTGPPLSQGKNILSQAVQDLCSPQAESLAFAGHRRGQFLRGSHHL